MIDRNVVLHIAGLARLGVSNEDVERMTVQLGSILSYIEQLNSVDTSQVEPTSFMAPEHDPFRDDTERPSLTHDKILQNGPCLKKGYFAIPKVIGG